MKPIEPGAHVLVTLPNVPQSGVIDQADPDSPRRCSNCVFGMRWSLRNDDVWYCECILIRIDDDPDALTQSVEEEVEI